MVKLGIVLLSALAFMVAPAHPDISAVWELQADFDDHSLPGAHVDCTFKQDAERLTGMCADGIVTGEVKGDHAGWEVAIGATDRFVFSGTIDENRTLITGRFVQGGKGGGPFFAVRR